MRYGNFSYKQNKEVGGVTSPQGPGVPHIKIKILHFHLFLYRLSISISILHGFKQVLTSTQTFETLDYNSKYHK